MRRVGRWLVSHTTHAANLAQATMNMGCAAMRFGVLPCACLYDRRRHHGMRMSL